MSQVTIDILTEQIRGINGDIARLKNKYDVELVNKNNLTQEYNKAITEVQNIIARLKSEYDSLKSDKQKILNDIDTITP